MYSIEGAEKVDDGGTPKENVSFRQKVRRSSMFQWFKTIA